MNSGETLLMPQSSGIGPARRVMAAAMVALSLSCSTESGAALPPPQTVEAQPDTPAEVPPTETQTELAPPEPTFSELEADPSPNPTEIVESEPTYKPVLLSDYINPAETATTSECVATWKEGLEAAQLTSPIAGAKIIGRELFVSPRNLPGKAKLTLLGNEGVASVELGESDGGWAVAENRFDPSSSEDTKITLVGTIYPRDNSPNVWRVVKKGGELTANPIANINVRRVLSLSAHPHRIIAGTEPNQPDEGLWAIAHDGSAQVKVPTANGFVGWATTAGEQTAFAGGTIDDERATLYRLVGLETGQPRAIDITPESVVGQSAIWSLDVHESQNGDTWLAIGTRGIGHYGGGAGIHVLHFPAGSETPIVASWVDQNSDNNGNILSDNTDQVVIDPDDPATVYFTTRPRGEVRKFNAATGEVAQLVKPEIGTEHRSLDIITNENGDKYLAGTTSGDKFWEFKIDEPETVLTRSIIETGAEAGPERVQSLVANEDVLAIGGSFSMTAYWENCPTTFTLDGEAKDVDITENNSVVTATYPAGTVFEAKPSGELIELADLKPQFNRPVDIAVDPKSGSIAVAAVADNGGLTNIVMLQPNGAETVEVWEKVFGDVENGGTESKVRSLAWSQDGDLFAGLTQGLIARLDPSTGEVAQLLASSADVSKATVVGLAADGPWLWASFTDGRVSVFEITSGNQITTWKDENVGGGRLSAQGGKAFVSTTSHNVLVDLADNSFSITPLSAPPSFWNTPQSTFTDSGFIHVDDRAGLKVTASN